MQIKKNHKKCKLRKSQKCKLKKKLKKNANKKKSQQISGDLKVCAIFYSPN